MTDSTKTDVNTAARAANDKGDRRDDYEIGYGKPPKEHRFKPGQSGNPEGRRKGTKNTRTILNEILNSPIKVREGDKSRTITKRRAILELTFALALKQDPKAFANLLKLLKDLGELNQDAGSMPKGGVFVLPMKPESPEEWQEIYGEAARGAPIPQEIIDIVNKKTRRSD